MLCITFELAVKNPTINLNNATADRSSASPQAFIQKILVLYLLVWSISPPLEIDWIYRILALGATGLWFAFASHRHLKLLKIHRQAIGFAVAVALIVLIDTLQPVKIFRPIAIYVLVIAFIMNHFYQGRWQELSGFVPIILLFLLFYNYQTVTALGLDHTIARRIVRNDTAMYFYLRQGVGGYSLIYPQVCLFPALLVWVFTSWSHNRLYFALGCAWLLSYLMFCLRAGYTTAIFVSVLGLLIFFFYKKQSLTAAVVVSLAFFFTALFAVFYLDGLREFLLRVFEGTAVTRKLSDLAQLESMELDSTPGISSLETRIIRYMGSITTMLHFPIIGGLWFGGAGGHSALLDTLAVYGLWGGPLYAKMLLKVPVFMKEHYQHPLIQSLAKATFITIFFTSLLNPNTYSFMFFLLILLPLIFHDILRWRTIAA
jgi:hypothetical protein